MNIKEAIEIGKEMHKGMVITETTVREFKTVTEAQVFISNISRIKMYKDALRVLVNYCKTKTDGFNRR